MPVIDLETLKLEPGSHDDVNDGMCIMEAVSYVAGEPFSDHPACVSPVLGQFLRTWNDDLDDAGRQQLKPYIERVIGTAGDGHDELRGWICADWLVRVHTPAWLELAGITESAQALRDLPPLRSLTDLQNAQPVLDTARAKSTAAGDAAWAAARAAAGDAAWDAAGDAAWAAAGDAAGDAAWDAAWAAARAAAWDAAWDAGVDTYQGRYQAAREAVDKVLADTQTSLQKSALELIEQLIDPSTMTEAA